LGVFLDLFLEFYGILRRNILFVDEIRLLSCLIYFK
jgi:hypothetical protein